jgi:hypothetical protein
MKWLMICLWLCLPAALVAQVPTQRLLPVDLSARYAAGCQGYDQYVPVFRDEFDRPALDTWFWKPNLANHQHAPTSSLTEEYASPDQLVSDTLGDGALRMRAEQVPIWARGVAWHPDGYLLDDGLPNLRTWPSQSAALTAQWRFAHGQYSVRAQIPSGKSMWPAFWMYGDCSTEIVGFEYLNQQSDAQHDRRASFSVHKALNCATTPNLDTRTRSFGQDMSAGYHLYTVRWDDFAIHFMVDGQVKRSLYHFYQRRPRGGGFQAYHAVTQCSDIQGAWRHYEDPQFSEVMLEVILNVGVRKGAPASAFPREMRLDYFLLQELMDCDETRRVSTWADLQGVGGTAGEGDRSITAGRILVAPSHGLQLHPPPAQQAWLTGDLLVLTAAEEIVIRPGFEVLAGANLVAQISPCQGGGPDDPPSNLLLQAAPDEPYPQAPPPLLAELPQLYPNPATHAARVEGLLAGDQVQVLDAQGRQVFLQISAASALDLPVATWPAGLYLVTVRSADRLPWTTKLIHP